MQADSTPINHYQSTVPLKVPGAMCLGKPDQIGEEHQRWSPAKISPRNRLFLISSLLCTALLLAGCGGASESPAPAPAAPQPVSSGLLLNQRIEVQGAGRTYHLYLPVNPASAPIVFLFHGFGDSNDGLLGLNGRASPYEIWLEVARRDNVILVVPNGLNTGAKRGWNDCRRDAIGNSVQDDVFFIRTLLDSLVASHRADPKRVYATGTSNGGHFSIRLGLELGDRIAAFAAIAAANSAASKCAPSTTPVSALFMNGTADPLLPYGGGQMSGERGLVLSAEETVADWVSRNGTETTAARFAFPDDPRTTDNSSVERLSFRNGRGGSEVVLYRVTGGGHNEPSIRIAKQNTAGDQNRDIEMAEEVWQFFRTKSRP